MTSNNQPSGFLLVDKPVGPTSHDVVATVRRLLRPYGKKIKVGHAGTLDPYASGLLILGIGSSTKALGQLLGLTKSYETTIRLGATTATDDAEATPIPTAGFTPPKEETVRKALEKFIGTTMQLPPPFSAKKINGVASYIHARQGKPVTLRPVPVTITALALITYSNNDVKISLTCSSGTYVRAVGRDLGVALGTGGYIIELRRTEIGPFSVKNAVTVTELTERTILERLLPTTAVQNERGTLDKKKC